MASKARQELKPQRRDERRAGNPVTFLYIAITQHVRKLRASFAATFSAKPMECVELAPAFGPTSNLDSASKLDALHTLRAVRLRLSLLCAHRASAVYSGSSFQVPPRLN